MHFLLAYFWHVTDFHLDVNFTVAPDLIYETNDYFIGNYSYETCWGNASGIFGDYNCDASENLVISAIDFIKTHSENVLNPEDVSFVLWTGYASVLPTMLIFKWASEIALFKKNSKNCYSSQVCFKKAYLATLYLKNSFIIFHSKNVNLDPFSAMTLLMLITCSPINR